jgi:hypothetical protein
MKPSEKPPSKPKINLPNLLKTLLVVGSVSMHSLVPKLERTLAPAYNSLEMVNSLIEANSINNPSQALLDKSIESKKRIHIIGETHSSIASERFAKDFFIRLHQRATETNSPTVLLVELNDEYVAQIYNGDYRNLSKFKAYGKPFIEMVEYAKANSIPIESTDILQTNQALNHDIINTPLRNKQMHIKAKSVIDKYPNNTQIMWFVGAAHANRLVQDEATDFLLSKQFPSQTQTSILVDIDPNSSGCLIETSNSPGLVKSNSFEYTPALEESVKGGGYKHSPEGMRISQDYISPKTYNVYNTNLGGFDYVVGIAYKGVGTEN